MFGDEGEGRLPFHHRLLLHLALGYFNCFEIDYSYHRSESSILYQSRILLLEQSFIKIRLQIFIYLIQEDSYISINFN